MLRFSLCFSFLILAATHVRSQELIDPEKSLLIRHPSVVDSSLASGGGALSFINLFRHLSRGQGPLSDFVIDWLNQWNIDEMNGFPVRTRESKRLLRYWPKDDEGRLQLHRAPFRLLAVVNRIDLDDPGKPSDDDSFGELRFVYCAYDPMTLSPLEFTVIFEFHLPRTTRYPTRQAWARAFKDLSQIGFGPAFNERLSSLTNVVTASTDARYHLAQLRTNDFLFAPSWELREFRLAKGGGLKLSTTSQTPDFSLQNIDQRADLLQWVNDHREEILADQAVVPEHFLGGSAPLPTERFGWFGREIVDQSLRHKFSMMTCNGCHGGDTKTVFTHIKPRRAGVPARISEYLKKELKLRQRLLESRSIVYYTQKKQN